MIYTVSIYTKDGAIIKTFWCKKNAVEFFCRTDGIMKTLRRFNKLVTSWAKLKR